MQRIYCGLKFSPSFSNEGKMKPITLHFFRNFESQIFSHRSVLLCRASSGSSHRRRRTRLRLPLLRCTLASLFRLVAALSFVLAFPGSQTQHSEEEQASSSSPQRRRASPAEARPPHTEGSEARLLEKLVPYAASVVLSCVFAGLRHLDPNREASKKALEHKKEIAERLGRP